MRWRERQELESYSIEIRWLMGLLPLKFQSPAHAQRSLNRAHQELIGIGYVRAVEYVEKPVGRRYPEVWVQYHFGYSETQDAAGALDLSKAAVLPPPEEDPREVPGYLEGRVTEIAAILRAEKLENRGWYTKVAKTLPPAVLDRVIGLTRESASIGVGMRMLGVVFTAHAKKCAAEAGLKL